MSKGVTLIRIVIAALKGSAFAVSEGNWCSVHNI
jgi:hypothetical protein